MIARFAPLALLMAFPAVGTAANIATNSEMAAISKADQSDRVGPTVDWKVVALADQNRRRRTGELLDSGKLRTGEDFYYAALIFQHGETPNDYLKAHLLATVAMSKGQPDARWLAAASLDRYLHAFGRPQIFGTQFFGSGSGKYTQEPYDKVVVSDALRQVMQVPSLANQELQRREYETEASRNK